MVLSISEENNIVDKIDMIVTVDLYRHLKGVADS